MLKAIKVNNILPRIYGSRGELLTMRRRLSLLAHFLELSPRSLMVHICLESVVESRNSTGLYPFWRTFCQIHQDCLVSATCKFLATSAFISPNVLNFFTAKGGIYMHTMALCLQGLLITFDFLFVSLDICSLETPHCLSGTNQFVSQSAIRHNYQAQDLANLMTLCRNGDSGLTAVQEDVMPCVHAQALSHQYYQIAESNAAIGIILSQTADTSGSTGNSRT